MNTFEQLITAELRLGILILFEARIADAISSFKQIKMYFLKNRHLLNRIIWSTEHLPQGMSHLLVLFYLVWSFHETVYKYIRS